MDGDVLKNIIESMRLSGPRLVYLSMLSLLCSGCIYHPIEIFGAMQPSSDAVVAIKEERDRSPRASLGAISSAARSLPQPSLDRTPEVERELASLRRTRFLGNALERRAPHYTQLRGILLQEGVPEELLNLAIVESGFRFEARSPAGAVGLWQLMRSTAEVYGLKVGFFKDERKDPIRSTMAAARHLRDLYGAYGDWNLALAAYNAGSAKIDRAMIRSGATDFWKLSRSGHLRYETVKFVPRFIATTLLVKEHEQERLQAMAPSSGALS